MIFDVDDVIYPWLRTAHAICERAGITNGNRVTQWEMHQDYGIERDVLWGTLEGAMLSGELYSQAPRAVDLAHMRRLKHAGHRIHVVTARGCSGALANLIRTQTYEWLRKWNVPCHTVTFTKNKGDVWGDFALDDGEHNVRDLWNAGTTAFLMDAPHNQGVEGFPRVHSVEEFVSYVLLHANV